VQISVSAGTVRTGVTFQRPDLECNMSCQWLFLGTLNEPSFPKERYVKTYGFELDPFQAYSVACVVRADSLLPVRGGPAEKVTYIAAYSCCRSAMRV
jgi:superfamily II RNA helicase